MRIRYTVTLLILITGFASTGLLAQDVIRGPYLQMQTDDGVTIHWRTDIATESVVRYGNAPDNLLSVETVGEKGGGSYVYRVCESGTSSCSDDIHIVF
jgi:hypothetical protein